MPCHAEVITVGIRTDDFPHSKKIVSSIMKFLIAARALWGIIDSGPGCDSKSWIGSPYPRAFPKCELSSALAS